jgi:hypothetical protein
MAMPSSIIPTPLTAARIASKTNNPENMPPTIEARFGSNIAKDWPTPASGLFRSTVRAFRAS